MSRELATRTRAQPHWRRPESHALIHASSRIVAGPERPSILQLSALALSLVLMTSTMSPYGWIWAIFVGTAAVTRLRPEWRRRRMKRALGKMPLGDPQATVRGEPLRLIGTARARA